MQGWQWSKSPVTRVIFRGQRVHVKRDDVFHLAGNKMRKLYWLVKQSDDFYRDAHLLSFGGAQSNAMLALAQLANAKRVPFTYFSRGLHLPKSSLNAVEGGNLSAAKELGMQHIPLKAETYQELVQTRDFTRVFKAQRATTKPLFIPQGAAFPEAQDGVKLLAQELNNYIETEWPESQFAVVLPCGTGTTALYLAQHLTPAAEVFAVPCVGDAPYLQLQLQQLVAQDSTLQRQKRVKLPTVLTPKRKSRFGRLWWPLYEMYHEVLQETKVDFDLVYGAFAWHTLFSNNAQLLDQVRSDLSGNRRQVLYVHTGGTCGNATMLERYERQKASKSVR